MQAWNPLSNAEKSRYEVVQGGFKFEHAGATFTEVKSKSDGSIMIVAELPRGDGQTSFDVMSPRSWAIMAHNADTILRFQKTYSESGKTREAAKLANIRTTAETLKGAGLKPAAIVAALKAEGHTEEQIKAACA